VVIAAGQERNDSLLAPIAKLGVPYRVVGGAKDAAELNAVRAFDEGLRAAHELAQA
jgi:2,4-dienoyl-CoA reductase (NADPH2)